jgi:hypothetical protein
MDPREEASSTHKEDSQVSAGEAAQRDLSISGGAAEGVPVPSTPPRSVSVGDSASHSEAADSSAVTVAQIGVEENQDDKGRTTSKERVAAAAGAMEASLPAAAGAGASTSSSSTLPTGSIINIPSGTGHLGQALSAQTLGLPVSGWSGHFAVVLPTGNQTPEFAEFTRRAQNYTQPQPKPRPLENVATSSAGARRRSITPRPRRDVVEATMQSPPAERKREELPAKARRDEGGSSVRTWSMTREGQDNEGAVGGSGHVSGSRDQMALARRSAAGTSPVAGSDPQEVPWSARCSNDDTIRDELWGFVKELEARGNAKVTACAQQAQLCTQAAQVCVATRESELAMAQQDIASLQHRVGEERPRSEGALKLYRHESATVVAWRARFKASQDSLSWEEKQLEKLQNEHKRSEDQHLSIVRDLKNTNLQHEADCAMLQRQGAAAASERDQCQRELQRCIQESIMLKSEHEAARAKLHGELSQCLSGKDAQIAEYCARLVERTDRSEAEVAV